MSALQAAEKIAVLLLLQLPELLLRTVLSVSFHLIYKYFHIALLLAFPVSRIARCGQATAKQIRFTVTQRSIVSIGRKIMLSTGKPSTLTNFASVKKLLIHIIEKERIVMAQSRADR